MTNSIHHIRMRRQTITKENLVQWEVQYTAHAQSKNHKGRPID